MAVSEGRPAGTRNAYGVYLIAGVLAGIAALGAVRLAAGPLAVPMPPEVEKLAANIDSEEASEKVDRLTFQNAGQNTAVLLSLCFASVAGVFGMAEGVRIRSGAGIAIGLVGGLVAGGIVGWLSGSAIYDLQYYVQYQMRDGMLGGLLLHAAVWCIAGVLASIAIAAAARSFGRFVGVVLPAVVAGGLGAVLFGLLVGTLFAFVQTDELRLEGSGGAQAVWAFLPAIIIGLGVARASSTEDVHHEGERTEVATEPPADTDSNVAGHASA